MSDIKNNASPDAFFLHGSQSNDDINSLAPPRKGMLIEPLIDGMATFKSMEEAIASAKVSVYLALWVFNPDTPILSSEVRKSGITKWINLLGRTADRGVNVRVLLTDFDPILSEKLHCNNWNAFRILNLESARLGDHKRHLLQSICSLHPATVSFIIGSRLELQIKKHVEYLNNIIKKKNESSALKIFSNWLGLWKWVGYQKKNKKFVIRDNISLYAHPACHHQKICIIDGITAYCGGLDINKGRISTPSHDDSDNFWHDVHFKLQGLAALDIYRNFINRWNEEVPLCKEIIKIANNTLPPMKMINYMANSDLIMENIKVPSTGNAIVQIHRTKSEETNFPIPNTIQDDIKQGYKKAISQAKKIIYIENQYVRLPELSQWLIDRAKAAPELRIIIVVPVAPEEVGETGKGDEITEHGLALQHRVFVTLQKELKDRIGIFSLIMKIKGRKISKTEIFGSPQIYVHSKLMIIDDVYINIGSANANKRSFYIDTEISAACYHPGVAKKLRLSLWREHLGNPREMNNWKEINYVKEWNKIAEGNTRLNFMKRQGFIIPYDITRFPGEEASNLLDKFTEIFDFERSYTDTALV